MEDSEAAAASERNARPIAWRVATVTQIVQETRRVRTLVLELPDWPGHRAGQHVDVRLTADDGYQTERSYSIASPPEDAHISLTIERLEDGEVSSYLADELRVGDKLELRGPIGGHFVWSVSDGGPLLLVGGGSGIVPLMAMLRHRAAASAEIRREIPARLLYSSRSWAEVIYRDELARLAAGDDTLGVTHTITREPPPSWTGFRRRIDRAMLAEVAWPPFAHPRVFVCGPTPLVETVAEGLVALGHEPTSVRTERFGPTGGRG
ncbi:MAG: ferredoxin reductase [Gemmatimonadaceae bacterium]|nr:ferredoxin reductase [Gemmatimonadaceae bacterium]